MINDCIYEIFKNCDPLTKLKFIQLNEYCYKNLKLNNDEMILVKINYLDIWRENLPLKEYDENTTSKIFDQVINYVSNKLQINKYGIFKNSGFKNNYYKLIVNKNKHISGDFFINIISFFTNKLNNTYLNINFYYSYDIDDRSINERIIR